MASLTIGGQTHALVLRGREVADAEDHWRPHTGRTLLDILSVPAESNGEGPKRISFFMHELEGFCWGAWHRRLGADKVQPLLDQFYAEGGTIWELNQVVTDALIDGGLLGRRAPPDPPPAGEPPASGLTSPS